MAKLHYCLNGTSVTEQVIKYQDTREGSDFLPIQIYYDNYKDYWYSQLEDYIDRISFESDFDFKLSRAVDTFREATAKSIAKVKGYGALGAFNGWFYSILRNWKSNVKTSSFRLKKRPSVQCPVCDRHVARIDVQHLEHYKSLSDMPKFFVWQSNIYETSTIPKIYATTWGEKTLAKLRDLQNKKPLPWSAHKRRVRWPWKLSDGSRGVMCPFTKKVIAKIDEEYIRSLPDKYSRYAEAISWEGFVELYPTALIQSEVYSLDHISSSEEGALREYIADNSSGPKTDYLDWDRIKDGKVGIYYEHAFDIIEKCVEDSVDRDILKLFAIGYTVDDIVDELGFDKSSIRQRIKILKNDTDMEKMLQGIC